MIRFSQVTRAMDAAVHATHSGIVIRHDFSEIVLGHFSFEALLAAYVLIRLAVELGKFLIRGWRECKDRCAELRADRETASEAIAPVVSYRAGTGPAGWLCLCFRI